MHEDTKFASQVHEANIFFNWNGQKNRFIDQTSKNSKTWNFKFNKCLTILSYELMSRVLEEFAQCSQVLLKSNS